MTTKTFNVISTISMALSSTVAVLGLVGIVITGIYPGVIVLVLLALIPITSRFYVKKTLSKSNDFQKKKFTTLTVINALIILVVLWMTFVIMHDRILKDCC